jgi:hypothetical protein
MRTISYCIALSILLNITHYSYGYSVTEWPLLGASSTEYCNITTDCAKAPYKVCEQSENT